MGATRNFFEKKKHWSEFKDRMLGWYLKPYIAKLLYMPKELYIIDCFAGKGKFDDGSIGSPLIIANEIRNVVNDNSRKNKKIKGVFIENKYGKFLKANLNGYTKCYAKEKSFEECIEGICELAKRGNIFLYIDPYGIKNLKFDYIDKMCNSSCGACNSIEMFINFSSIGFIREACRLLKYNKDIFKDEVEGDEEDYELQDISIENMNKIFNGDSWQKIIKDFYNKKFSFYALEEKITQEYIKNFNSEFKYYLNIPIRTKQKNTPKYRMIFCTNSEDGLILMNQNMNDTIKRMKDEEERGQISLFNLSEFNPKYKIDNYIMKHINNNIQIKYKELVCKIIMEINIMYNEHDIRETLVILEREGKIKINRIPKNGYEPARKLRGWDTKKYDIIIHKELTLFV
ncbi:MAG: three-Cys-motif partner protein TcmP [Clostridium butyricum]|nr:three-Cys-motif partner protein TcmP [Clostridium butyricum]